MEAAEISTACAAAPAMTHPPPPAPGWTPPSSLCCVWSLSVSLTASEVDGQHIMAD